MKKILRFNIWLFLKKLNVSLNFLLKVKCLLACFASDGFASPTSFDLLKIFLAASVSSHQGLRGQEEQRNRRTGKARAPSFQAAELQVHRYNQSPQTTLLVKRELSLAQKWWTLQDLQDWHHLHLLHPGGQEETFHISSRSRPRQGPQSWPTTNNTASSQRASEGVGEEAEIEQILKRKPEKNQISERSNGTSQTQ